MSIEVDRERRKTLKDTNFPDPFFWSFPTWGLRFFDFYNGEKQKPELVRLLVLLPYPD